MDHREEMQSWIATVVQNAAEENSGQIRDDINLFVSASGQLASILAARCEALARKSRPRDSKPPKSAPAKSLQPRNGRGRDADTPQTETDALGSQRRPKRISRIQQGLRKAKPSPQRQQRSLLSQIYGPQNSEVAFQKAAKTLAS